MGDLAEAFANLGIQPAAPAKAPAALQRIEPGEAGEGATEVAVALPAPAHASPDVARERDIARERTDRSAQWEPPESTERG